MKLGRPPKPLAVRFWDKVKIDWRDGACWNWVAGKDDAGYGQVWIDEKRRRARAPRVAWFLTTQEWPSKWVLHTCDNPSCVRPLHLFLGTNLDNVKDRVQKGRSAVNINPQPGEKNGNSKLSTEQVLSIRSRYTKGEKQVLLAKEFHVTQALISQITRRTAWKCLGV